MLEHSEESKNNETNPIGQHISVVIQYGYQHLSINGIFLGETEKHFIVKKSNNKVVYINKTKILYHIFDKN